MTMKAAAEACVASARSQTTAPPLANTWQGSSPSEITAAMMQRHFDQNAHGRDAQAQQRPSAEQLRRNEGNAGYARGSQTPNMSGGDPDGGSGHGTTIPNAPFQKLDPDADHDGKGCAFFTKPAVTNDGGRLNYYGEGAYVVYGKWMYKCEYGRWSNMGPTRLWSKADVERLNAEKQETSTLRSYPFFEKD